MPNIPPSPPQPGRGDGFLALAPDWTITCAAPAAGELVGQNLWLAFPELNDAPLGAALRQAMQQGAAQQVEQAGPGPGEWSAIHIHPDGAGIGLWWVDVSAHKQAELALRQSEAREAARLNELEAIMEAAPAIIWVTRDPQARQVSGNRAAYEFLRLRRDQNLSKTAPADQAPRNFRVFQAGRELPPEALPLQLAAASGQPVRNFEEEVVFDDGDRAYLLGNVTPLLDEAGRPAGAVAAFIDVTSRIAAEKALHQALEEAEAGRLMLDALMDNLPEGITITGGPPDFPIQRVSRYGQNLIQRADPSHLLGLPAGEHNRAWNLHSEGSGPPLPAEQMPLYRATHLGQVVTNQELYIRASDGRMIPLLVNATPIRDASGQVVAGVSSWRDIRERKQTEDALRERSQRLALLSQAAAALLNSLDPVGLLQDLYPQLSARLGLDTYLLYRLSPDGTRLELAAASGFSPTQRANLNDLALGQSISGWVAQNRQARALSAVQQSTAQDAHLIRRLGIRAYTSHPLLVQDRVVGALAFGSRQRDEFDPEAIRLIHAVADLIATAIDRRSAELNSQRYASQLERSNRDLQEFAFVASHDLQEPLRKIETFGDILLQRGDNLTPIQRDYLERMRQAAGRMRNMITGLLALSRLEREAQPFELADLSALAAEALSNLEAPIQRLQARVEVAPLPTLEVDPQQVIRLFQNLIGNALKFQPPGEPPHIRIYSHALDPAQVAIVIEDNGIGVPEEAVERIFQPFQRAVGRSQYEGSGMGLAICRKIVERHGGRISVRNLPSRGAAFQFTLPGPNHPQGEKGDLLGNGEKD